MDGFLLLEMFREAKPQGHSKVSLSGAEGPRLLLLHVVPMLILSWVLCFKDRLSTFPFYFLRPSLLYQKNNQARQLQSPAVVCANVYCTVRGS